MYPPMITLIHHIICKNSAQRKILCICVFFLRRNMYANNIIIKIVVICNRIKKISGLYNYFNNINDENQNNIVLSSKQTQRFLKEFGFFWPFVNKDYLYKIVKQMDMFGYKELTHE